jgi:hypothetical protein
VITYRSFDVVPERRTSSWIITRFAGDDAPVEVDANSPTGIHELILGVPRQDTEPLPALLAAPIDPRIPGPPMLGKARFVTIDDTTMWFAVPQDWFFKHFQLAEPA